MSDIEFFLAFLCPLIVVGLFALFRRNEPFSAVVGGLVIISLAMTGLGAGLAHYLAGADILRFNPSQSLAMFGEVPFEIYFALFAKAFLAGLLLFFIRPRIHRKYVHSRPLKFAGLGVLALAGALAATAARSQVTAHLGAVLLWGFSLFFLEWLGGSSLVWRTKFAFLTTVSASSVYFWLVEGLALRVGLWQVNLSKSLGVSLFNVPVERALFHFFFAAVACLGLEIFWRQCRHSEYFYPKQA